MQLIASDNTSLLEILAIIAPDSSKNTLRSWLEKGRVLVDGRVAKKGAQAILKGQTVSVGQRITFAPHEVKILYEDDHLVVVNKPEGLLSVSTDFDRKVNVHSILKRRFYSQQVYPVHRLDREVSGVMVFAYSEKAKEGLKKLFHIHDIQREYIAIVEGTFTEPKGTWESFLKEDAAYFVRSTSSPDLGKRSVTHYEVITSNAKFSLLRLTLETGRKNQIRVHCKEAGHPIVGDIKYGATTTHAGRLCLHARRLQFVHPVLEKPFHFESPLPEVFYNLVKLPATI